MPKEKMSHDQARQLVCCVCTNLRGSKAIRAVSDAEEKVVRDKVYFGYDSSSVISHLGSARPVSSISKS